VNTPPETINCLALPAIALGDLLSSPVRIVAAAESILPAVQIVAVAESILPAVRIVVAAESILPAVRIVVAQFVQAPVSDEALAVQCVSEAAAVVPVGQVSLAGVQLDPAAPSYQLVVPDSKSEPVMSTALALALAVALAAAAGLGVLAGGRVKQLPPVGHRDWRADQRGYQASSRRPLISTCCHRYLASV
jgi:hypothetical protein